MSKVEVFSFDTDNVIKSKFITAKSNYKFALERLFPLIDKLDIQRNIQSPRFYQRLEKDIIKGCIMPPLTIAFIEEDINKIHTKNEAEDYIQQNIDNAFVLDGIQRLNTLQRSNKDKKLDTERPIFLNILICSSMDNLLYRMITLNNGQKAMTTRHQIEILADFFYDFSDLPIKTQTEKERKKKLIRGSFRKSDIIKAYIAFLSNSTNIDNQKIIAEKMDQLIADKIMDANITEDHLEFFDVMNLIDRFCKKDELLKWFKNNDNNLVGFCAGIHDSFNDLKTESDDNFNKSIEIFENFFKDLNPSKIKVGQERRKMVSYFISKYKLLSKKDEFELLNELSQI